MRRDRPFKDDVSNRNNKEALAKKLLARGDRLIAHVDPCSAFMRLASILNCSEPVLGGAQNNSDCSTFTIVSDSRSHWLLHHPDHSSIAVVAGSRHRNGGQRLHYVVTTDAIT